ncbi:hypothetical protein DFH08DRAFT_817962 [Mycena albidolilacea]|uniref:Uncharacterized protein n=1 Tax=Mycena albidolilacea TaxID=1033008 RepID=A0AAD6ZGT9_9AGAR|nr:hypothetical protein DFH08DRAFT_817962 [Mycena albidolilacea]
MVHPVNQDKHMQIPSDTHGSSSLVIIFWTMGIWGMPKADIATYAKSMELRPQVTRLLAEVLQQQGGSELVPPVYPAAPDSLSVVGDWIPEGEATGVETRLPTSVSMVQRASCPIIIGQFTFLKHLNKILKNINSNNWTGGKLKVSMMQEFHRKSAVESTLVRQNTNIEAIGTIQDASHSSEALDTDQVACKLAAKMKLVDESHEMKKMKHALCTYYNWDPACPQVWYNLCEGDPGRPAFMPYVDMYNYAVLDGRWIPPTSQNRRNSASSSLIQPGIQNSGQIPLIMVAWMKESEDSRNIFPAEMSPLNPKKDGSQPEIIPLEAIQCQIDCLWYT